MTERQGTLRWAVMCDGTTLCAWEATCIRELLAVPGAELAALVVNSTPRPPPKGTKLERLVRGEATLWELYERFVVDARSAANRPVDMSAELAGVPVLRCPVFKKGRFSEHFHDADIEALRALDLDFMLRFAYGIIRGAILGVARRGVWSFHHDDVDRYRGTPPGFWEIVHGEPETGAILQRLTERLDGGVVLRRGSWPTLHHSYRENRDRAYVESAAWPAEVARDLLRGEAPYLDEPPAKTSAPIYLAPSNRETLSFLGKVAIGKADAMRRATRSKRALAADAATISGITRVLETVGRQSALVVLNYHRVGDPARTPYDPDVFSATVPGFDEQVKALRRRYAIVSLAEAAEIVAGRARGLAVLLTFDDGYVDSYENAFPVLRAHGVPATFFVVTSLVGTHAISIWDRIAYAVRRTRRSAVRVGAPYDLTLDLRDESRLTATRQALDCFRSPRTTDPEHFVSALFEACEIGPPDASERLFLSWAEAAEMVKGGMDFGSHTHTHPILAKLPFAEQVEELATSRRVLAEKLGVDAIGCAYPDGAAAAYNRDTFAAMREAGYRMGFTFFGGVNHLPVASPFDVKRTAVSAEMNLAQLRVRLALAGVGRDLGF